MDIEFIVFLAIMLHKAPAAFGLVTFLLHEGLERQRIRKHLMIFALSAPVMALVTFLLLAMGGSGDPLDKVSLKLNPENSKLTGKCYFRVIPF